MSVKEQIVKMLQSCGYDLFTACEYASEAIAEFEQSGKSAMIYNIVQNGRIVKSFEIRKG